MKDYTLTFLEIFQKDGLYKAASFRKGVCFKIESGVLSMVTYDHIDDLMPHQDNPIISKFILEQPFQKLFTRQASFK